MVLNDKNEAIMATEKNESPFTNCNLIVQAQQTPGNVLFENYEQLKTTIENGITYYSQFDYTIENYDIAIGHHAELKFIKNTLEKAKREIIKGYNLPLETVKEKIDFLLGIIKVPFKKVDSFIKENDKRAKKYEIYTFARSIALYNDLESHVENILQNPLFFESTWLNSGCSKRKWQMAVVSKIRKIANDIKFILSLNDETKNNFLLLYYQTLSLEMVEEFRKSLNDISNNVSNDIVEIIHEPLVNNNAVKPEQDEVNLSDYEILNSIINFVNPYTRDTIYGIDGKLKEKLKEIAQKVKLVSLTDEKSANTTPIVTSGKDVLRTVVDVYKAMSVRSNFGATMLVNVLRGSRNKYVINYKFNSVNGYGALRHLSCICVHDIIDYLVQEDFLKRTRGGYPTLKVNKNKDLKDVTNDHVSAVEEIIALNGSGKSMVNKINVDGFDIAVDKDGEILTDVELLRRLSELRNKISNENGIPCNRIAYDKVLVDFATKKPLTKENALSNGGIRESWFNKYGILFLQEVINYEQDEKGRR